jgi:hypothetical protein
MKFKDWDGNDLEGNWMITEKIDGIQGRLISDSDRLESKNSKLLNNLPKNLPAGEIFEIYNGDCHDTWSVISGPEGERERIKKSEIFKLWPEIDSRLIILKKTKNPTAEKINYYFKLVLNWGGEGLVLRNLDNPEICIKVKESYTKDTKIIGFVEGKGKFKGKLGKFLTEHGGVGIGKGLTTKRREELWKQRKKLLGTFIEVKCMHMTKNDKFFQPRLVRLRPDK